jgi:hypothetical protein
MGKEVKDMRRGLKSLLAGLVLASTLVLVPATVGAHGAVQESGNVWKSGTYIYGAGTVSSSYNHNQLSITVTLQKYSCKVLSCPGWYGVATNTKTRTNTSIISLQVSAWCAGTVVFPTRVKVSYRLETNGQVHSNTYYRDQTPLACT